MSAGLFPTAREPDPYGRGSDASLVTLGAAALVKFFRAEVASAPRQ